MEKLKAAGLYMSSLVPIKGSMIERYNECLSHLGIKPTELKEINVDAIGWSPEVAEEKNDNYYLNHGGANPYGIIISPHQEGKPLYFPFHSFDRRLVDLFFDLNRKALSDITSDSAVIINLDQNIDAFYEPSDLIDYDVVTVGFHVLHEINAEQIKQKKLIAQMYEGNNCLNLNLHSKILASANRFGDLRPRALQLAEVDYKTTSFYTKAFGGVFVLRSEEHGHLLIFESEEELNKYKHSYTAVHISRDDLIPELTRRGYIHFDESKVSKKRVDRISNLYFSRYLADTDHEISEILSNKILYQKYLNELSQEQRTSLLGPSRYLEKLEKGHEPDRTLYMNDEVFTALHSPAIPEIEFLLWILICRLQPSDPYLTYYYDKELFYKEFETYNTDYQLWVIELIKNEINSLKNS